jgi:protein-tyrosine kinase
MSEFFKALEQAERDRLRQDQTDSPGASPLKRPGAPENGAPVTEPVAPQHAAPKAETLKPSPSPGPVPTAQPARPSAGRAAAKPAWPAPASAPASVFRRSLRTSERSRLSGRFTARQPVLVTETDPNSIEADAYRTVRANIELMSDAGAVRRIAITSAAGGDGKSTTAANLAVVAAQGGRRVCLIDGDLRRPALHDVFGLSNVDGLALALEQGKPLHAVARLSDIENLSIVVAGRGTEETSFHDLFTPQRLETLLRESEAAFDLVLFDSPPVVLAETLGIAAVCDGVILVVRAGSIPFGVLRRAVGQVRQVKGKVLGVLLNRVDPRTTDASYYGAYHTTRSKA